MAVTLADVRQWAGPQAGRYIRGTVKSAGNSTTTAIVSSMITSLAVDSLYNDYFLYFPAASAGDKIRVVSSFAPSTGTLTVDRIYSGATIPDSKAFELSGIVRPFADDLTEGLDWTQLINFALLRCFVEVEITATPVANATRHDLTTGNTWLTNPEWVKQVGALTSAEVRAETDPYQNRTVYGQAEKLSNLVYINHKGRTFSANETIYVKSLKPAYFHCAATGGALGSQSGLAVETDEIPVTKEWVGYGALVELTNRFGMNLAESTGSQIAKKRDEWARLFTWHSEHETASLPPLTFRPRSYTSVRRSWRGGR